jgi:DNA-binding CsgD family transcriptional regulator
LFRGDAVQASGWFGRAERLLETADQDCVERGYLLIPLWLKQMASGDHAAGNTTAAEAAEIGERFGDADLMWLASDDQGRALVNQGRVEEGLRLVDGVLVAALAGELSPLITGIVYCNTIAFCQDAYAYELRHAREWTEALTRWCERQPEMVAHNGLCLVHRAEIMQLQGAWDDALAEATRAAERFTQGVLNQLACGTAHYREGELRRLRGDFGAAEAAYREASRCGVEPQPGLALPRVAQDRVDTAAAWIRRAVGETTRPLKRVALLPAYVEIMLAVGERGRSSAWRARLSATSTRPGSSGRPPRLSSRSWGAGSDLAHVESHLSGRAPVDAHGLTARELEVLRLVAAGSSNREIAAELVISEHTVARHLQNIFAKLGVSSRTAATAFAFERDLL